MLPSVTIEELRDCPWASIISQADKKTCFNYWGLFKKKASELEADSPSNRGLLLLEATCSMSLNREIGEPAFIAMFSGPTGRTTLPQDMTDEHLEVFFQLLPDIFDPELKSRIADIIWLNKKAHKFDAAKIAVPEYIKSCEILRINDAYEAVLRICRAVDVACEMGKGGSQLQQEALAYAEKYALEISAIEADGHHSPLYRLLSQRKYGDQFGLAKKCAEIAANRGRNQNYHLMRSFLRLQHDFMRNADAPSDDLRSILLVEAESYVSEAQHTPSAIVKSSHLEHAITAFRKIPNSSERVETLHEQLILVQQKINDEMSSVKTEGIDITQLIESAEQHVSGHKFIDALMLLSFIVALPKESQMRANALESIHKNPIHHLMGKKITNEKGKTIGKVPPLEFNCTSENGEIVTTEMFQNISLETNIQAEALILPAMDKIKSEHLISLEILLDIVSNHPFIPDGRELIFARGLLFGFNRDFASSCLYLVPQIENSIRNILETKGIVITSKLLSSGIQREKDLNELLNDNDVIKIFGDDTVFTLRALMTEQHGGNIRNLLAHGLLSYDQIQCSQGVYCWWLVLRLIMTPFLSALK